MRIRRRNMGRCPHHPPLPPPSPPLSLRTSRARATLEVIQHNINRRVDLDPAEPSTLPATATTTTTTERLPILPKYAVGARGAV